MVMQHMAGNMRSRWTDFLTSDGEKPWRNRDRRIRSARRDACRPAGVLGVGLGRVLFDTLASLTEADLGRTVTIRAEPQTALTALTRQLSHYAGHAYQIVLLAKHLKGAEWRVLSIPRGQSRRVQRADGRRPAALTPARLARV